MSALKIFVHGHTNISALIIPHLCTYKFCPWAHQYTSTHFPSVIHLPQPFLTLWWPLGQYFSLSSDTFPFFSCLINCSVGYRASAALQSWQDTLYEANFLSITSLRTFQWLAKKVLSYEKEHRLWSPVSMRTHINRKPFFATLGTVYRLPCAEFSRPTDSWWLSYSWFSKHTERVDFDWRNLRAWWT